MKHHNPYFLKHFFSIQFLFLSSISFSQLKFSDSIWNDFNNCKIDTSKIDKIIFASDYLRDSKPDAAIEYGKAALAIAQRIKDSKREGLLMDLIGQGYDQKGDIANAIAYFNGSFRIANERHDINAIAGIKLNLGACYTDVGNFKLGVSAYKSAVDYYAQINDKKLLCRSEVFLSDALYKSNNPDSSLFYLEKAKPLSIELSGYLLHYIYTNFAECYFLKGNYKLARENVTLAMGLSEKLNDLYALSADYLVLAKVYLAQNDYKNAELYVKKGYEIAIETQIRENLIDSYKIFSSVYEKQGKYQEALKYKSLFIITKDSLESALNDYILQDYENEKRDETFAMMKADELSKNAELRRQKYIIVFFVFALIMFIGITIYIFYSRITLKKANIEIELINRELNNKQKEIIAQNEILIRSNEQISLQSEDIKKLSNLKDRLFSIISHDLRSPLNSLQTVLSLFLDGNLSQDKFQTIVPNLVKGVSTTSDLVENLLHWSKSQLTGATIVSIQFDINLIAQRQIILFEKQASDKQIELINEIRASTLVFADIDMIDLVLRNLVANAIKFCLPNRKITISASQTEEYVTVNVNDEGIGISTENIQKVFQDKERFSTRGTANEAGTGLGLLLCKDFIEKNNGTIGVESKLSVGTRFWFTLPIGEV